ncbi:MAG: hypothetical protein AAFX78_05035 [Cyanobacteria bacterium J06638_20]
MTELGEIEFSHPSDALPSITTSPDLGSVTRSLNLLTDASSSNQAGTDIISASRGQMYWTWGVTLTDLDDTQYFDLLALFRYSENGYSEGTPSPIRFLDKMRLTYPAPAPHPQTLIDQTTRGSGEAIGYCKVNAKFVSNWDDEPLNKNLWRVTLRIKELV